MSLICKTCGEELIGAVNRCWNCGAHIAIINPRTKPPIRREPVELTTSTAVPSVSPLASAVTRRFFFTRQLSPGALTVCAHAALWVGGMGCLIGMRSMWCWLPALIGIGLGVVGMQARRRDLAATGLVLSVLALFLVFVQLGLDQYARHQSQLLLESYDSSGF